MATKPAEAADGKQNQKGDGWQPTYQMKPKDDQRFIPADVKGIIEEILNRQLKDVAYDAQTCKQLSLKLSEEVRDKVKGV